MSRQIYRPVKPKGYYKKSIWDLSLEAVRNEDYQVFNYIFNLRPKIWREYWSSDQKRRGNQIPGNLHLIALMFDNENLCTWLQAKYLSLGFECKIYDAIIKYKHYYRKEFSYNAELFSVFHRTLYLFNSHQNQILFFDKLSYQKIIFEDDFTIRDYIFSSTNTSKMNQDEMLIISDFSKYFRIKDKISVDLVKIIGEYLMTKTIVDKSECSYNTEITDITEFGISRIDKKYYH